MAITSAHLATATLNATISRDASLVELFVNGNLRPSDLVPGQAGAARQNALNSKLRSLTRNDQILRVEVRAPNGEILFASEPLTVGDRPLQSQGMKGALAGTPSAAISASRDLSDVAGPPLAASSVVAEYLPLVGADGRTAAVMAMWRDAAPLLASVAQVQRDVVIVVLGAATVLAVMLFLVFRAAQLRINRQQAQLLEATRRDPLTGLLNHGAVVTQLADLLEVVRRGEGSVGVALLDVDNFTLLNDTHGHLAGDAVLRGVADLLDDDESVFASRYGPDEFLLVETGASANDVELRVADLRARLTDVTVQFGDSERLPDAARVITWHRRFGSGLQPVDEGDHQVLFELRSGGVTEALDRLLDGQRLAVGTRGGHGAERVGDRHDAADEGDLLPLKALEVAASVPAFVVMTDAGAHCLEVRQIANDGIAQRDVLLEDVELLCGELARLAQQRVGDADFPDVVQQPRDTHGR